MSYSNQYHEDKYDPQEDVEFELEGIRRTQLVENSVNRNPATNSDVFIPEEETVITEEPTGEESVHFVPRYYPERVIQDKERDLMREKGICLGEYVNDVGAKNREFRVTGKLITPELGDFHKVIDLGHKYNLVCMQWQGEVLLKDSELDGPVGVDPETRHWIYDYQFDLVSTGKDEQHSGDNGIIRRGDQ